MVIFTDGERPIVIPDPVRLATTFTIFPSTVALYEIRPGMVNVDTTSTSPSGPAIISMLPLNPSTSIVGLAPTANVCF